jgi:putative ABC transport system ATP-binding protein
VLTVSNLTKSYAGPEGEVRALDGISFGVAAGEVVALQGPSGCGKTTLLLAAGGLLRPDGGTVAIDGRDVWALAAGERARLRARMVGFVFQQYHLIPYLNLRDNIRAAAIALPATGEAEAAEALIDRLGLRDRAAHVPAELSAGEKQRAALARALLNRPKLLLADEPTGNLDRANADAVIGALRDFAAQGGAVLLATHNPEAAAVAHRSLRLEGGRIAPGPA